MDQLKEYDRNTCFRAFLILACCAAIIIMSVGIMSIMEKHYINEAKQRALNSYTVGYCQFTDKKTIAYVKELINGFTANCTEVKSREAAAQGIKELIISTSSQDGEQVKIYQCTLGEELNCQLN